VTIDGTIRRYLDEPVHLAGMREGEPLHVPTLSEYFASTSRVLLAGDVNQFTVGTPFNLRDGPPPVVLGSFQWSSFGPDGMLNINLDTYFNQAQILGTDLPYRSWRIRGLFRAGYMVAYYGTTPDPSFTGVVSAIMQGNAGFRAVSGGWALALGFGNLINEFPGGSGHYYFMGGPPGSPMQHYYPTYFQVEVGYGLPTDGTATRLTGGYDWPAWGLPIRTDLLSYRAQGPTYNCFNGFANAPNVPDSCPNKNLSYIPPGEP
jgi:hypothetical protein